MTQTTRATSHLTTSRLVEVTGLLVAAAGVLTLYFSDLPGFPTIPPGPIILGAAAALVAILTWRWAPAIGLAAAVFLTIGMFAAGTDGRLGDPGNLAYFVGTWLMLGGLILTAIAALMALKTASGPRV